MSDPVAMIDAFLVRTTERELFSADEVADLLLDLRTAMVQEPVAV